MGETRVLAAQAVARAWEEREVPFVVMHGLEGYPHRLGRDLDILMAGRFAGPALEHAAMVLVDLGWRVAFPPPLWGQRLVALRGDGGDNDYIELHTMTTLRWAAMTLANTKDTPDHSIGHFPVSSWATFAKTVVTPLLGGDTDRFSSEYLRGLLISGVTTDLITSRSTDLFGRSLAQRLASAVESVDIQELNDLTKPLRKAALGQMARHPSRSARAMPKFLKQKLGRFYSDSGLRARLTIPSGTDSEPIVEAIIDKVEHLFVTISVTPPGTATDRLREQYRVLARQGLVLELAEAAPGTPLTTTTRSSLRDPGGGQKDVTFEIPNSEDVADQVGVWLIDQWLTRFADSPASDAKGVARQTRMQMEEHK